MTQPTVVEQDPALRALNWAKAHRKPLTILGVLLVVIAGGIWFWLSAAQRRETFAQNALAEARAAAAAGNLALASSDLSRLVGTYSGTTGAGEGTILLAQIRLLQDQAALAVTELRQFMATNPPEQFRAPALGLLGTALEQTGAQDQAAEEYLRAAAASWYDGVQAQYLLDAARALTQAGDTSRAIATYERILEELDETGAGVEARVRLGELRPTVPSNNSA